MKQTKQWCYLAPEIEVNEIAVEQGFAISNGEEGGSTEQPGEGGSSDW